MKIESKFVTDKLKGVNPRLLEHPVGRVTLTKQDPALFALVYLPHHITNVEGAVTFNSFHEYLCDEYKKTLMLPLSKTMGEHRDVFVAPRESGKSTWLFTILPLWAAAHGHASFVAAFAHSGSQAEQHLQTFKRELDGNELLNQDFPALCTPMTKSGSHKKYSDSRNMILQANGFAFSARGIDTAVLGLKVGTMRPDWLVLDDIEPGEANYSDLEVQKRMDTLLSDILPINSFAKVSWVGTPTRAGSMVDNLVQTSLGSDDHGWVEESNFDTHYFPALFQDDDDVWQSVWPEKWTVADMLPRINERAFKKNYQNLPAGIEDGFWSSSDYSYEALEQYGPTIISVDPAVTSGPNSDPTGIAVISKHPDSGVRKLFVRHCEAVRLKPQALADYLSQLLSEFPETTHVLVEANQGGDLLRDLLTTLPVRYEEIKQSKSKEVRADQSLFLYQRGMVVHADKLPELELQQQEFPSGRWDDMVDAVNTGVLWMAAKRKKKRMSRSMSYL